MTRGYCGIGIEFYVKDVNVGTLWRSAHAFGASFIFTVGREYKRQASDTTAAWKHVPLYHYLSIDDLYKSLPHDCRLVGVEIVDGSYSLPAFIHPEQAVYLLGSEVNGLTPQALQKVHMTVQIPTIYCLNVAVAGSIVLYDRVAKERGQC